MTTFGRKTLGSTGFPLQVSADGDPRAKHHGITLDWATVAAAGADVTWNDGNTLKAGRKGLRYGQVLTKKDADGKFGPYDPAALDGRQTLARGRVFILNETVLEEPAIGIGSHNSDHPAVLEGGRVWKARILATDGAASLAAGPTFPNLEAALPLLSYVQG